MHDAALPACGRLAMNQPEDNMQSLETRLRAIEDHIAIQSIIAAYGPAVDTPDGNVIGAAYAKTGRYQAAYGEAPHATAGLAYDGIAAIGALINRGGSNPLSANALTQGSGFAGVNGIFRLRRDGTNERGLAIATIRNNQMVILEPAPRSFRGAGF